MTLREKLEKEHPEEINSFDMAIYCPTRYGYADKPVYCKDENYGDARKRCGDCWNREIPETDLVIGDPKIEHPDTDIPENSTKCRGCRHEFPLNNNVCVHCDEHNLYEPKENKMIYAHVGDPVAKVEEVKVTDEGVTAKARILDSGNRRQFESGAVRDIQEGKGRCDLLPLDVVAEVLCTKERPFDVVLYHIAEFKDTGKIEQLQVAVMEFGVFSTAFKDLPTMVLEVSKHFEEGAKKYGENNWQKGIPVHCYIDSAVRHYLKFLRGDKDEPHDRAFCWNIMCAIWTCKHKPELNEYVRKDG